MNALKSVFNFLGRFLTSTRIVLTNLITFIFLALVFIGLISVFIPNDRSIDKEGKVVILNPEGVLVDQEVKYSDFQFSFGQVEQIQTRDLIKLIQSISKDEDIPAVLLDFSGLSYSGPTNLIEISEEIQKLSELKRVIAFSDRYTTSSYLIAAHADEIYIHQAGGFDIQGIGGYRSYNKSLYENLKMKVSDLFVLFATTEKFGYFNIFFTKSLNSSGLSSPSPSISNILSNFSFSKIYLIPKALH